MAHKAPNQWERRNEYKEAQLEAGKLSAKTQQSLEMVAGMRQEDPNCEHEEAEQNAAGGLYRN